MANSVRSRFKLKTSNDTTCSSSTPVKMLANAEKDYSPVFVPCTQESLDNVDVLWDWNSPHSKPRQNRRPKRIISSQKSSPKLPIKKFNRHVAANSFDKIRDELKALQAEIEIPSSPPFEFDDGDLVLNNNQNKPNELGDFFDDSLEQELIMVSQQVEEKLKQTEINTKHNNGQTTPTELKITKASPRTLIKSFSSNTLLDSPSESAVRTPHVNVKKEGDIISPGDNNSALKLKTKSLSFGDSYVKQCNDAVLMDIERKRQAALAKLRARKSVVLSDSDSSPVKCSPEEIELKRQQALAKLEQKKKQEMIERNRQEALKRLEMNRRKRGV